MFIKFTLKQVKNPNSIGILASGLCLIHCLLTPLFFAFQPSILKLGKEYAGWWQAMDLVFLFFSFIAILASSHHTSRCWMKYALWSSWIVLVGIILNEKFQMISIPEAAIYIPSFALIVLHLINRNYCKCTDEKCCVQDS